MSFQASIGVLSALLLVAAPSVAIAGGEPWLGDWAVPLSDDEMDEARGGLRDLSFAIEFEGSVNGVEGQGIINLIDPAMQLADGLPTTVDNPAAVGLVDFIGEVGPFQGIGQWAIVNGNNNDVVNNLTVNIYVMDTAGALTTFNDVLPSSL